MPGMTKAKRRIRMKKVLALLTALICLAGLCAALAEERVPGEDTLYVTTDVVGAETVFRRYDESFYDAPSDQPGTVVKIRYEATVYEPSPIRKILYVYLPYGYDASRQYNIIYYTHGAEAHAEDLIQSAYYKNALDNMIAQGVCEPFIFVFPSYFNDYRKKSGEVVELWPRELLHDIMPLIESTYSTYAETADEAGFAASRAHRAFNGYSRGSLITWGMIGELADYAQWFLPFSGPALGFDASADDQFAYMSGVMETLRGKEIFIYSACGGTEDSAYPMTEMIARMIADTDHFSYGRDPGTNNLYFCLTEFPHSSTFGRFMMYNAFEVIFR